MRGPETGSAAADDSTPFAALAFDHRKRNFSSVRPAGMTDEQIRLSKELIFDAFEVARGQGPTGMRPGVIIDEEYGADLARRAVDSGVEVAMPVERAAQPVFTFEYGDDFGAHLRAFRPSCAKALVHYRTTDADDVRRVQASRLRQLSDFLSGEPISFMLELIVGQRADDERAAPTVQADSLCAAMAELQEAGVGPDIWKVEGTTSREDAARIVAQARQQNAQARCVVLGASASERAVRQWLDVAAATPGYSGFAIGRSIWGGSITAWLDGRLGRGRAVEEIASTYRRWALRYGGERIG